MKITTSNKTIFLKTDTNDVDVSINVDIPTKFYKYLSISKYSVENFQNSKLHFSHPFKLNDLMEGNTQLWDLEEYINSYHEKTGKSKEQIFQLLTQDFLEDVFTHRGVLCLATEYNNNLFWPHYTNEQGVCIEFDSSIFLKSFEKEDYFLMPIDYGKLERINFKDYVIETIKESKVNVNANLPIIYTLAVKDDIWKYENEWRIILKKKNLGKISHPLKIIDDKTYEEEIKSLINRNLSYNSDSISKIILSTLFFNHNRFNKIDLQNENLKYYFKNFDKPLFDFLLELKNKFNSKIFQIDRDINENQQIVSKINYQIEIVEITTTYIIINRKNYG